MRESIENVRDVFGSFWAKVTVVLALLIVAGLVYYLACLNHVSINEICVYYDSRNGKVWVADTPGWYRTSPFVLATYISTLPQRVTIPSAAPIIVQKYVRFKKEGVDEYIRLVGWDYSMNNQLNSVLLGYAFSGGKYSFMEIMQEAGQETTNPTPLPRK